MPVLSKNSENAVIRIPLYLSGFQRYNRQKAFNIKHFRRIRSIPKLPSKIAKQPLIHKTRNQLYLTVPWVRIPPSPPQSPVNSRVCWTFLFLHTPDETIIFVLELADFLLEQHYLNPNPGSYLVRCSRLDRSYLPIGFRSHLNPEEAFLFPSLVQRKFWICSRDGRKYLRLC